MARGLSDTAKLILRLIADGCAYNQIATRNPGITCEDIFNAAAEALRLADDLAACNEVSRPSAPIAPATHLAAARSTYHERLEEIKRAAPKAYERWTDADDAELARMFRTGTPVKVIAQTLQRQAGAIRSRLVKLGLDVPIAKAVSERGSSQPIKGEP